MPNNQVNADGGGNGSMTALLAILVIAVVAFGLWYVMRGGAAPSDTNDGGAGLNIEIGGDTNEGGASNPSTNPPANQPTN